VVFLELGESAPVPMMRCGFILMFPLWRRVAIYDAGYCDTDDGK
jgi:hypothetical protein